MNSRYHYYSLKIHYYKAIAAANNNCFVELGKSFLSIVIMQILILNYTHGLGTYYLMRGIFLDPGN